MNDKKINFLLCFSYFVVGFLVYLGFVTHRINMSWLFDADTLYLSALYSDVVIKNHSFFSWRLPPAPYFFPDMFFYFIINFFEKNIFYAFLFYAIFQNILFIILVNKITFVLTRCLPICLLINSIFLLILSFFVTNTVVPYAFHVLSSYHVGSLLNGLFFLYFLLIFFEEKRLLGSAGIVFFSIVGGASDMFFILWFVFPALFVFFQMQKKNKVFSVIFKRFLYLTLIGMVTGLLLKSIVTPNTATGYFLALTTVPWIRIKDLSLTLYNLFSEHIFLGFFIVSFYLFVIKNFFRTKNIILNDKNFTNIFIVRFIVVSALFSVLNIVFSKLAKLTIDLQSFRYLLNLFWFPVIFFWVFWPERVRKKKFFSVFSIVFFVFSVVSSVVEQYKGKSPYQGEYVPPLASCVDESIERYNSVHADKVKYGLATYWQARLINQFSQYGLDVSVVKADLQLMSIITSTSGFREKYDFILVNKKTDDELRKRVRELYGVPVETFTCSGESDVLVYPSGTIAVSPSDVTNR